LGPLPAAPWRGLAEVAAWDMAKGVLLAIAGGAAWSHGFSIQAHDRPQMPSECHPSAGDHSARARIRWHGKHVPWGNPTVNGSRPPNRYSSIQPLAGGQGWGWTATATATAARATATAARAKQRSPRVARAVGLLEAGVVGVVVVVAYFQPKTAPGPSEELLAKQEQLRETVDEAKDALSNASPEQVPEKRAVLREKLKELSEIDVQVDQAKEDMAAYPEPEYLVKAGTKGKINICVTGASGVGKSSWINTVRRLNPKDEKAAKTGVTETTMQPEMFSFPQTTKNTTFFRKTINRVSGFARSLVSDGQSALDDGDPIQVGDRILVRDGESNMPGKVVSVSGRDAWDVELDTGKTMRRVTREKLMGVLAECVLWDLPGVGTPNYPQAEYIKEMGIRYFDVVVLMTSTRFTEAELMLVEELRYWRIPFFLVRNKTDVDVQSEIEAEEDVSDDEELTMAVQQRVEQETIQTIKDYFLSEFNLDKVYCISTKRKLLSQFDFLELEKDITDAVRKQRN